MNMHGRTALATLSLFCAFFLITGNAGAAGPADTPAEIKAPGSGWNLKFEDNFVTAEQSLTKWDIQRYDYWLTGYPQGMASPSVYNSFEGMPYAPDRNSVSGGQLHQTIRGGRAGTVNTLRKFNFTYGYVEARIKVPDCNGCWPAFWMLGSNPAPAQMAWPPEIDIFEFFPNIPGGHPLFNSHWRDSSGVVVDLNSVSPGGHRPATTDMANYTGAFHTYGFLWTKDYIQGFIDGIAGVRYSGPMVPHVPMYLIHTLQQARGYVTPEGSTMHTDYVRVYQ